MAMKEAMASDDPDREMNPIILQYMAKSTLRAVLTDKNALRATTSKRGISGDLNADDLTNQIFSAMAEERKNRVRELQRKFLMFLLESLNNDPMLLGRVFRAFVEAVKEQKENPQGDDSSPCTGIKRMKKVVSQPDFSRLMRGLRHGQEGDPEMKSPMIGVFVQILERGDQRSACKGLQIKGESATGKAWEISNGSRISFLDKNKEGKTWKALGLAGTRFAAIVATAQEVASRPNSAGGIDGSRSSRRSASTSAFTPEKGMGAVLTESPALVATAQEVTSQPNSAGGIADSRSSRRSASTSAFTPEKGMGAVLTESPATKSILDKTAKPPQPNVLRKRPSVTSLFNENPADEKLGYSNKKVVVRRPGSVTRGPGRSFGAVNRRQTIE